MSWKETCYIGDWTLALPVATLKGPDALQLVSDNTINSCSNFEIGQYKHFVTCNEDGKVICDGVVMRLGEDEFIFNSVPVYWISYQVSLGTYDVTFRYEDIVDTAIYQVTGPTSLYLLEELAGEGLRDIRMCHFAPVQINGKEVRLIRGLNMSGEIGFELQVPMAYAKEIYDTVFEVGQKYGIRRLGHRSAMINHLEACFPTGNWHYLMAIFGDETRDYKDYVQRTFTGGAHSDFFKQVKMRGSLELDDVSGYYTSPVEMGWTKSIKFDHDFVGRKALEKEVANPRRTVVTLEFDSEDMVDVYASYFEQGEPYGSWTSRIRPSGSFGPTLSPRTAKWSACRPCLATATTSARCSR